MTIDLLQGDCLDLLPSIPDKSIDAILTDLPYGTTACRWDSIIPFEPMWAQVKRILKPRGVFVTTASQPFTSKLIVSNLEWFRHDIIWRKVRVTGHLDAKRKPLREHEEILIFCEGQPTYNPQMVKGEEHVRGPFGKRKNGATTVYNSFTDDTSRQNISDLFYPRSTIEFISEMQSIHPTQKPVALYEYLIKTYTNEGDTVLDFCAGSGTTGIAALNTGRNCILIEKDAGYFEIIQRRIADAQQQLRLAI